MLLSFCTLSHKSRKRQLCIFLIISSICILRNGNFQIFVNFFTPASQKKLRKTRRSAPFFVFYGGIRNLSAYNTPHYCRRAVLPSLTEYGSYSARRIILLSVNKASARRRQSCIKGGRGSSRTAFMTQAARKKQISLCVAVLHVTAQSPLAKIHVRTDGNGGNFYEKQRRRQNTAGDRSRL